MRRFFLLLLIACGKDNSENADLKIKYELSLDDNISDIAFNVIYGSDGDIIEFDIDYLSSNINVDSFYKKIPNLTIGDHESIEIDVYQITKTKNSNRWQNCIFFLIYNDFENNFVKASLPQLCHVDHIMNFINDQNSKGISVQLEKGEIIYLKNSVDIGISQESIELFSVDDIRNPAIRYSVKGLKNSLSEFQSISIDEIRRSSQNGPIQFILSLIIDHMARLKHLNNPALLGISSGDYADHQELYPSQQVALEILRMAKRTRENLNFTKENENFADLNHLDYLNYQREIKTSADHPIFYSTKLEKSISFNLEDSGDSEAFNVYDNLMRLREQRSDRSGRYQELDFASGIIEIRQKYNQRLDRRLLNVLTILSNAMIRRNRAVIAPSLHPFFWGSFELENSN